MAIVLKFHSFIFFAFGAYKVKEKQSYNGTIATNGGILVDIEQIKKRRSISVFVSSTFRDMKLERDIMMSRVFHKIRKLCEQRGVLWSEIDLRWGITKEEKNTKLVLPICLRRINDARPIFIGLLGERYGWVPDASEIPQELLKKEPWLEEYIGRSITEIEFLYGALLDSKTPFKSLFYLRNPLYSQEHSGFIETDLERVRQLRDLKTRLKNENQKGTISLQEYDTPERLAEMLLRDLTELIDSLFPLNEEIDDVGKEELEQDMFARSLTRSYVDRPEFLQKLDSFAEENSPYPLMVVGKGGNGKSTILAKWALNHMDAFDNREYVVTHFVGANGTSADPKEMVAMIIKRLWRNLSLNEVETYLPNSYKEIAKKFTEALFKVSKVTKKKVILVIDGVDRLHRTVEGVWLSWLPTAIPYNISLILSTADDQMYQQIKHDGFVKHELIVGEMEAPHSRSKFITNYLDLFGKKLDKEQMNLIIKKEETKNPLFLRFLLEDLRLFGEFEEMEKEFEKYANISDIEALISQTIRRIQHNFKEDDRDIVQRSLQLIFAAKEGLTEKELLDILGENDEPLPSAIWSPIYLNLESFITEVSGQLFFTHEFVKNTVKKLFITEIVEEEIHSLLAGYFKPEEGETLSSRAIDVLPYHLMHSKQWGELANLLQEEIVVTQMKTYTLLRYWTSIEEQSSIHKIDAYKQIFEQPETFSDNYLISCAHLFSNTQYNDEALNLYKELERRARAKKDLINVSANLNNQASIYYSRQDYEKALELLEQSEEMIIKADNIKGYSSVLNNKGNILKELGREKEALQLFKQAEEHALLHEDQGSLASACNNQAILYKKWGEYEKALSLFKEAEYFAREGEELTGLATLLNNQGDIYSTLLQWDLAQACFEEAERINRQIGDRSSLAACLNNRASLLEKKGEKDEAIALWLEAEVITREIRDDVHLGMVLFNMAGTLKEKGEYDKALGLLDETVTIKRRLKDFVGLSKSLNVQASIYKNLKQFDVALGLFEESILLLTESKEREGLAITLINQAILFQEMNLLDQEFKNIRKALPILREINDEEMLSNTLGRLGALYVIKEEYFRALKCLKEAEEINRRRNNEQGLLNNVFEQGCAYYALQQEDTALEYFIEAKALAKKHQKTETLVSSTHNIGVILQKKGNFDAAKKTYFEVMEVLEELNNIEGIAACLCNFADLYVEENDTDQAVIIFERVIAITKDTEYKEAYSKALRSLAGVYFSRNKWQEALKLYKEEYGILDQEKELQKLSVNLSNQGFIYRKIGNYKIALPLYEQVEQLIRRQGKRANLLLSLNELGMIYQENRQLSLALKKWEEALAIAKELGKTEEYLITLSNQAGALHHAGKTTLAYNKWKKSAEIAQSTNSSHYSSVLENYVAALKHDKKWKEALEIYIELEAIYKESNNITRLQEVWKNRNILQKAIINLPKKKELVENSRNNLCSCGSGKKYKKCCLNK